MPRTLPASLTPLEPRLRGYLAHFDPMIPGGFARIAALRFGHRRDWPESCFVPSQHITNLFAAEVRQILSLTPQERVPRAMTLGTAFAASAALSAWRTGKGVYTFDPDTFEALWHAEFRGKVPARALEALPEWGVYLAFPEGVTHLERPLLGAFVHLDHDLSRAEMTLKTLLDFGSATTLLPLHLTLTEGDITVALHQSLHSQDASYPRLIGATPPEALGSQLLEQHGLLIRRLVSVVLYLCSAQDDPGPAPRRARAQKVRGRWDVPESHRFRTWDVGLRLGAALRAARHTWEAAEAPGTRGNQTRPHLRRCHWHGSWIGPRDAATLEPRLLAPILVNASGGDALPMVVRPVSNPTPEP